MRVSVIMTSYNGQDYIYEQMRSIFEQSVPPDEVMIFDDGSKDGTIAIIRDFISKNRLINWKLTVNSGNKGWMRNFIEALKEAHGDYIFFSDQDDIWYPDKIENMVTIMEKYPDILCLSGKVSTIDSNGTLCKRGNNYSVENCSGNLMKQNFSADFNTVILPGCSMCIANKLADLILKIDIKTVPYDEQCCKLGLLLNGTYILDKFVIHHRIHAHNTSNFGIDINFGSSNLKKRLDSIKNNIIWLEKLLETSDVRQLLDREKQTIIKNTISFQNNRIIFLYNKNIMNFIQLLKYKKYYSGITMYFGDFSYAYHLNKVTGKLLCNIQYFKNFLLRLFKIRYTRK